MGLMPIIGECLYNKICELVYDGSINDELFVAYKDLLDDKIQPYLIYKTLSNIIPILNAKLANLGSVVTNDEHVVNLSQGEADLLKTYYSERCDFYTKRLQEFIKNNASAFPEIACGCGNMQPNLESSENSVGLWLGGSRGKVVSNGKCACSSTGITCGDYQSGFTDGQEFQKRKLAITGFTENGRYIREDGYSEVVVNVETGATINNQEKSVTITSNTITSITYDEGYTGLESLTLDVDVPQTGHTDEEMAERYSEGYRQGQYFQKTLMTSATFDENGTYTRSNGYSAITVDVPQTGHTDEEMQQQYQSGYTSGYTSGVTDGFDSGYTSGETHQKSLLSALTITQNGNYNREDGYSAITVNVSGQSAVLTTTAVTSNGEYSAPQGYDGFSSFEVNVAQTGHTDEEMQQQYQSGYTNGFNSGYTSGETHQKSLLSAITITSNGNYNRANGYSAITVNVPQSGYSQGYTDGYNDAYNELGYITVEPSSNNKHYNDTGITLTVSSNVPWVISNYPVWAVPNVLSGNGDATVVVALQLNEGGERRGYVDFNSTHGSIISSVYIRQGSQPSPTPTPTGLSEYLTFEIISGGTIKWENYYSGTGSGKTIEYSKNGGNWSTITSSSGSSAPSISVSNGDIIRFRGNNQSYNGNGVFTTNVTFNVYGNIMSLINSTNFSGLTALSGSNNFYVLFANCSKLKDAGSLVLPATTLANSCYEQMFAGCSGLTRAPELPATTLAKSCYCAMFQECRSLTTAPALSATTLVQNCYEQMFSDCESLLKITCLATNISASYCTYLWVDGTPTSDGVFYKNPSMNNWTTGVNGIPEGWTVRDNS